MMASADLGAIAGNGVHVIRMKPNVVIPEFVHWWLNHPSSKARLATVARGSNVPFIAKADLERFDVPVPSLEVQRQIVAVDDLRSRERVLMNRLDALNQHLADSITLRAAVQNRSQE
jgi:restriction endonuclease S subunit